MRTIKGGIADKVGKIYSINVDTALVPSGSTDFSRILGDSVKEKRNEQESKNEN